jgi:hypothetical protein
MRTEQNCQCTAGRQTWDLGDYLRQRHLIVEIAVDRLQASRSAGRVIGLRLNYKLKFFFQRNLDGQQKSVKIALRSILNQSLNPRIFRYGLTSAGVGTSSVSINSGISATGTGGPIWKISSTWSSSAKLTVPCH